ncbi:MAG: three-Cys-motif partner protein TcmP [Chloroflexi bacterium]|nr:three-Cys-motif partner protein TcmP [Chloroflexota bacterium]
MSKFLVPWSAKLGYKVKRRGEAQLWYVDGFSGPGRYGDGAEGSPIIGARQALQIMSSSRDYALGCINVEIKRLRFRQLEKNTQDFRDNGVTIRNLHGDFSSMIGEILEIIGQDDPVVAFIDSFGVKPLKFDNLLPLITRRGETDIILTFQTAAVPRLVKDYPHYVTQAVNSSRWQDKWDEKRVDAVIDDLTEQLLRHGRFLTIASYPIRSERDRSPKYHLMLASRSYDAFELVNNSVWHEEEQLDQKALRQLAQSTFLSQIDAEEAGRQLIQLIPRAMQGASLTTREQIVRHIVLNCWGEWHTSEIKQAVGGLVDAGRIIRHKTGRGKIDTDRLTLA